MQKMFQIKLRFALYENTDKIQQKLKCKFPSCWKVFGTGLFFTWAIELHPGGGRSSSMHLVQPQWPLSGVPPPEAKWHNSHLATAVVLKYRWSINSLRVWLQNISATRRCHPGALTATQPLRLAPEYKEVTKVHNSSTSIWLNWHVILRELPSRGWQAGRDRVSLPCRHRAFDAFPCVLPRPPWRCKRGPGEAWRLSPHRSSARPVCGPAQTPPHLWRMTQMFCVDNEAVTWRCNQQWRRWRCR